MFDWLRRKVATESDGTSLGIRGAGESSQATFGEPISVSDLLFAVKREPVAHRVVFTVAHDIFDNWFEVDEVGEKPDPNFDSEVQKAQADTSKSAQNLGAIYAQVAFTTIPAVLSMSYNLARTYTILKATLATATVAQWLYNKALMVTHALSGPAGWAVLGIAAAVTAAAVAWASMNRQQQEYNRTLEETTRDFRDLTSELSTMSPTERLQRQYQIVREYYGYSVSVGNVNVTAASLGSPFDRERAAEDVAKQIGHKLALKVIAR